MTIARWLGFIGLALSLWWLGHDAARAAVAASPVLRVETGGHTSIIYRLAIDPAGRLIATASRDKTLRLWSLETKSLVRTLRVPIGLGEEGALYSVVFSPDGRMLATGGWTCESERNWCLYLFDVQTGRMIRRIDGLPHRAMTLAFSPDGRFLAASLKLGAGLIVFRTEDFSVAGADPNYDGSDSPWVEFMPDGRIVTISRDGRLRLYAPGVKLLAMVPTPDGDDPTCLRVSPDGRLIAIGYDVTPAVSIVSGDDLRALYAADTRGTDRESFKRLAWSRDGAALLGAGGFERSGRNVVRRWPEAGRGRPSDFAVMGEFVSHLAAFDGDRVVFASTEPSLGILEADGRVSWLARAAQGDFREMGERLRISPDASTIALSLAPWGEAPVRFALGARRLAPAGPAEQVDLAPARRDAPGFDVRIWDGADPPELNGRVLSLMPNEHAVSFALTPDARRVALGTWWNLYLFERDGRPVWKRTPPGEVRALNITPDSRLLVAALGDGTVRWYRTSDGAELAALFIHVDGRRWVMWTPHGYYVASPGGDALIGWHVNNGAAREADFFGVARFRAHYYRPDIVEATLRFADEERAIERLGGESLEVSRLLPPVVFLDGLEDGAEIVSPRLMLRIALRAAPGSAIRKLEVRADGRPIASLEGRLALDAAGESVIALPVTLPRRDVVLSVQAESDMAVASEPASARLSWAGPGAAAHRPNLYAVAIGISHYQEPRLALGFAAKDARDFAAALEAQAGQAFASVNVMLLLDDEASRQRIEAAVRWLREASRRGDVAALFLAGHGVTDGASGFRFLAYEADTRRLDETSLGYAELRRALSEVAARAVLFIDACHAGATGAPATRAPFDIDQVVNDLASAERGVIVFASSTGDQLSAESAAWGNGAFTKALVEGLRGRADLFGEGDVTVATLDAFVSRRVARLTAGRQTPATGKPIGADLLLARAARETTP